MKIHEYKIYNHDVLKYIIKLLLKFIKHYIKGSLKIKILTIYIMINCYKIIYPTYMRVLVY